MPDSRHHLGDPVTAADVEQIVTLALAAIRTAAAPDWQARAGTLDWDCWETVEHMSDDLFAYAAQLGPRRPPLSDQCPLPVTAVGPAARLARSPLTVPPEAPVSCRSSRRPGHCS